MKPVTSILSRYVRYSLQCKVEANYQTELVPAKATAETFELYEQYQIAVHNDKPDKVSMRGFSRFLCDSPLGVSPVMIVHRGS